ADGALRAPGVPLPPNGRLDGFEWKVPLAEIGDATPMIDAAPSAVEAVALRPPETKPAAEPVLPPRKAVRPKTSEQRKPVEPVIPLVHAPDDPGLDPGSDGQAPPALPVT